MKTRVISGLIMVPLLLVIYFGGFWLWLAALLISLIGIGEFYKGFQALEIQPSVFLGRVLICALFGALGPEAFSRSGDAFESHTIVLLWLFIAVAAGMIYGWKINERGPYDSIATVVSMVYIPFFTFHMVLIDMTEDYSILVWLVVIAAFGSDIFAYFTGYFLGKHKMAPNLSPKKTIEGAVGGLIGSSFFGWLFGYIFIREIAGVCLILGLVGGLAGMAGDLTASAFKRKMGIKDYGTLIPGHGGIMDRFDSVIFVAPVMFYLIFLITDYTAI
jgi:phosphatidate cytidylyltransferase